MRIKIYLLFVSFFVTSGLSAQDKGVFSGNLESTAQFFFKDEDIGAANTPQYENQLVGTQAWLNLTYAYKGFKLGMRYDFYNNSNLQNPNSSFNGNGIGRWYINKRLDKLDITVGYIYDQIGTGIIWRAYEQRPLFIDSGLNGVRLAYDLTRDWQVKAFAGKQRDPLGIETDSDVDMLHGANIKGAAIDGFLRLGEEGKVTLAPGIGVVNRTLTDESVEGLGTIASTYLEEDREQIELKYNQYAFALYNRLNVGPFSWYIEGAYKTEDPIFDPFDKLLLADGSTSTGQYVNHDGTVFYTSLSYADNGFGVVVEAKRTEHFGLRTDQRLALTEGLYNFLPPMNRENTYRLTARYAPAVQDFGEMAYQADIRYSPNKKWSFNFNFSNITDLDDELLYREFYTEVLFKKSRKYRLLGGLQLVEYNQRVYEFKPEVEENVKTVVPFMEYFVKLSRKKSLRIEAQYMDTEQDFGSWMFGLVEYGIAPHWLFTVSDMYNIDPTQTDKIHYPTAGVVYTNKGNRFGLSYVKQVEGIVCAGGVCRLEPAFSGFRFDINSTF